jgi:ribosomal protein L44E
MSLPKIKQPIYIGDIPSNKTKFSFKPFLVKEQKNLLIALESDDLEHIYAAFIDIVDSCVLSVNNDKNKKLDVRSLPSFDAESVFLQISARSIGEKTSVRIECEKCQTENDVDIIINDVTLKDYDPKKQKIQLTDDIGIELKYPSLNDIIDSDSSASDSGESENSQQVTQIYKTIKNSIVSIYDKENVYPKEDMDAEELDEFIDSLSIPQMQKIENFFNEYPYLANDVKFTCKECGTVNETEIKGLKDFFF